MSKTPLVFQVNELTEEEVRAIKACHNGDASPHQQRLCLAAISNKFCRTHDLHYVPGSSNESAFLAGRAFVGSRIMRVLNLPVGKLQEPPVEEQNDDSID